MSLSVILAHFWRFYKFAHVPVQKNSESIMTLDECDINCILAPWVRSKFSEQNLHPQSSPSVWPTTHEISCALIMFPAQRIDRAHFIFILVFQAGLEILGISATYRHIKAKTPAWKHLIISYFPEGAWQMRECISNHLFWCARWVQVCTSVHISRFQVVACKHWVTEPNPLILTPMFAFMPCCLSIAHAFWFF